MKGFDCDGVITIGLYPGPNGIIITGRSYEEMPETIKMLDKMGIRNPVYFNPLKFSEKTRVLSERASQINDGSQTLINIAKYL